METSQYSLRAHAVINTCNKALYFVFRSSYSWRSVSNRSKRWLRSWFKLIISVNSFARESRDLSWFCNSCCSCVTSPIFKNKYKTMHWRATLQIKPYHHAFSIEPANFQIQRCKSLLAWCHTALILARGSRDRHQIPHPSNTFFFKTARFLIRLLRKTNITAVFHGLLEWDSVNEPDNDSFPKLGVGLLVLDTMSVVEVIFLPMLPEMDMSGTVGNTWNSSSLSCNRF